MAYSYGRPFRYQKRRPSARGSSYRPAYSRSAVYPRRPAGGYSRYSRKKASRYGRPRTAKRMAITPKNGFVQGDPLSQYQLAQIDAFDPRAVGVKIPDSNTTPSCGVLVSDDMNLTSPGTNNAVCYALQPSINTTLITSLSNTSAVAWTWDVAFAGVTKSNKYTSIGANFDLIRPVAHGVRISSSLPSTSAAGFVHIAVYPSRTSKATWDFPTSFAAMADCMWYTRITLSSLTQTPYVIQNKFLDCTAQRYIDAQDAGVSKQGDNPTAATINDSRYGRIQVANEWCTILIALEGTAVGGALTVPLSAETLVHYEALPAPGGVQAGGPAAAFDPPDLQGASAIGSQTNPVSPVTPGGAMASLREGATVAAQATSNLASEFISRIAPQARAAALDYAVNSAGQYLANRGASAQNNIGLIQN